ncbi:MAG: superoxide dismutase [Oscillospiraceae bacterium]
MPLDYAYDALEPFIDAKTIEIHHNRHLKKYVDTLNKTLENYPKYQCWSLKELIKNSYLLPYSIQTDVINNAGGVFNHNFYFSCMTPNSSRFPLPNLFAAIECQFCSFNEFKSTFKDTALKVFGSGYAALCVDKLKRLKIVTLPNQCTVLPIDLRPILMIDVWEHAYYLKYQNLRANYIDSWFELIDWEFAEECYL